MSLLDLPAPLLGAVDAGLGTFLPAAPRVLLWGLLGGAAGMGLYALLSPQRRIEVARRTSARARAALADCDAELADALPLIRAALAAAWRQLRLTLAPALLAALPLLLLLPWVSNQYGHRFPPPQVVPEIRTTPAHPASWQRPAPGPPRIRVGERPPYLAEVTLAAPVPVVEPRRWWNALIGNPAGYLPDAGPVARIEIDLPRRHLWRRGPDWLRGWEATFFTAAVIASLAIKLGFRIR
ncbi:MAG: hypothetical protein ACOY42_07280 [Pseudomonadota bacterium]